MTNQFIPHTCGGERKERWIVADNRSIDSSAPGIQSTIWGLGTSQSHADLPLWLQLRLSGLLTSSAKADKLQLKAASLLSRCLWCIPKGRGAKDTRQVEIMWDGFILTHTSNLVILAAIYYYLMRSFWISLLYLDLPFFLGEEVAVTETRISPQ